MLSKKNVWLLLLLSVVLLWNGIPAYAAFQTDMERLAAVGVWQGAPGQAAGTALAAGGADRFYTDFNTEGLGEIKEAYISLTPLEGAAPVSLAVSGPDGTIINTRSLNTPGKEFRVDVTAYANQAPRGLLRLCVQGAQGGGQRATFSAAGASAPVLCVRSGGRLPVCVFYEDFESGALNGFDSRETGGQGNITVSGDPAYARSGVRSMKIRLNRTDAVTAGSKRTEVVKNDIGGLGRDYWYAFSIYVPDDFVKDKDPEILTQWHIRPDMNLGEEWRSPPLGLKISGGDQFAVSCRWDPKPLTNGNDPRPEGGIEDNHGIGAVKTGAYNDFVFHIRWSCGEDGYVEVFRDGKRVLKRNGPNTYNDQAAHVLKMGSYKGAYKNETPTAGTPSLFREYWFDDCMIFTGDDILREVLPQRKPFLVKGGSIQRENGEIKTGVSLMNLTGQASPAEAVCSLIERDTGRTVQTARLMLEAAPLKEYGFTAAFSLPGGMENYKIVCFVIDGQGETISNLYESGPLN